MDVSQYKDYVLVLLFVKYVHNKYAEDPNVFIDVPPGGRFCRQVELDQGLRISVAGLTVIFQKRLGATNSSGTRH